MVMSMCGEELPYKVIGNYLNDHPRLFWFDGKLVVDMYRVSQKEQAIQFIFPIGKMNF